MDRKQILDTITTLQRSTREALRQLAEITDVAASDYSHVSNAQQALSEHMNLLIQLREEMVSQAVTSSPSAHITCIPVETEKRSRGGQKQFYLLDNSKRPEYVLQIRTLFEKYYDTTTRKFHLPDGSTIKSPLFLACIYDLGISQKIASEDAPVKDFAEIVKEAAADIPNFTTAYNTIQRVTQSWRTFIGNRGYCDRSIHLFSIKPEEVVSEHKKEYKECWDVMEKIEVLV